MTFARGAQAAGYKVIIAGAGGAAHLPGMTAALTPLPVFAVPVESASARRPRQPVVHRPDAARCPRRHAGHRQAGRHQRSAARRRRAGPVGPGLAERLEAWRARQTAKVAEEPQR
jgi:5-(carboxyamino)imidazole ribonucleotide mutase